MNEAELVLERLQAASSDTPEGKVFGNQIKDWTPEDQRRAEEAYSRGEWPLDHCPRCGASDGKHATGCPCAPPLPRTGKESEFANYVVEMKVRISRLPSFREPDPQSEDTIAEVIAAGGALVQTTIEIIKGEIVEFSISNAFKTRAEVAYVSTGQLPGLDGIRRLGLKFLDAPLPKQLIPPDAKVQQ